MIENVHFFTKFRISFKIALTWSAIVTYINIHVKYFYELIYLRESIARLKF